MSLLPWNSLAAIPPPAASGELVAYLEGLDALSLGRPADAVSGFSRALESSGDDPTFVLARGVAETLAEQFPQALKDFSRFQRLGGKGREAELWTYVAEQMGGYITESHSFPMSPRSLQKPQDLGIRQELPDPSRGCDFTTISIPGHVIQGRDDYPTAYASYIYYEMAKVYGKTRRCKGDLQAASLRQSMTKAGRWFAARYMKRADLAPAHLVRAKQLYESKRYEDALREIEFARASYPSDPDLVYYAADSWLALGRPITARREFTLALTSRTDFAPAYLGRAMAAAKLGDVAHAKADLDVAAKLDAGAVSKARTTIEAEMARQRVDDGPKELLARLEEAVRSGSSQAQLLDLAVQVQKASGSQRLRYDEIYQDRLRVLEDAVRADPKNPDKLVNLAEYMLIESDNRGETVEPRREMIFYRWQESKDKERLRAIELFDRALALNPKHVGGLIQKAIGLMALKRYDQAEQLADQALALSGNNADALRLYARFRAMRANQMSAEAASLRQERCSSSSRTENRSDGVYEVTTTTCIPPSQGDLQRAAQLDAAAAELRKKARAAMENAIRVSTGVEQLLIQADLHLWDGRMDAAQAALEQAVKLDPKHLEAQDTLVDFYAKTGQQDKAEEQQAIERQLIHTTAAPMLRMAWGRMTKTAWQGARTVLMKARDLDEADARTPAYLGVVLEGQEKTDEAIAAYRMAVALEEARLRLDEPAGQTESPFTRDPLDFGLAIQGRLHLARLFEETGKKDEALAQLEGSVAFEPRMQTGGESRQMFTAMLPDQQPERGAVVIAPVNAATLFADAHLRAGKLSSALGKQDLAIKHLTEAVRHGPQRMAGIPMVGNAQGDTNFGGLAKGPAAEASLYLAQALVAKGDLEGAKRMLYEVGRDIPEHLRGDLNELNMAMARMQSSRPRDPYAGMDPEQRKYADIQDKRDRDRQRMAFRYMAPNAKVAPELIGTWEMTPENKFLPWHKMLTIESNAQYTLISQSDGTTRKGKMDVQRRHDPVRGGTDPSEGQMMMYDESGEIKTMWYEVVDQDAMKVTDLDGTKYMLRRRP
jgi:tetratricopeptide (TPR) repeat protein